MNMLLLTLPGTPTTYYGEEIGMKNGNYAAMRPKDTFALSSGNWVMLLSTSVEVKQFRKAEHDRMNSNNILRVVPNTRRKRHIVCPSTVKHSRDTI